MPVLALPVENDRSPVPTAVFPLPVWFANSAYAPMAVLYWPVVLAYSA